MTDVLKTSSFTAFAGTSKLAAGELASVACAVQAQDQADATVLVFDDHTGKVVDLDLRGSAQDIVARYSPAFVDEAPRGRGRPKLGVVPREVTLLPRHWEWLQAQPGGASAALRRLVDEARKADAGKADIKVAQERTYRFLTAMAGDLAGYEEVVRALFASDASGVERHMQNWPEDIRDYTLGLMGG